MRWFVEVAKVAYLNVSFYALYVVFSAVYIPVMSVWCGVTTLGRTRRDKMRVFRRAISIYGQVIVRVLPFPLVRVRYREFGEDEHEPSVFVCNHNSASDPFLIGMLPGEFIQIVNIWPMRLPVLGWYARLVGCMSIREMPFEEFSKVACRRIEEGVSIACFPEGTRTRTGELGPFHSALFRVAKATRAPIVPLCIHGNRQIPAVGTMLLRPGVVRMHRLPSIRWQDYRELSPFQLKHRVRETISDELARLEAEVGTPRAVV